jgi:hypothetical protein
MSAAPTIDAAYKMGSKGGGSDLAERLAFEAWVRGHNWTLAAVWRGDGYVGHSEGGDRSYVCPHATTTRKMWAAWRDRAALAGGRE